MLKDHPARDRHLNLIIRRGEIQQLIASIGVFEQDAKEYLLKAAQLRTRLDVAERELAALEKEPK